MAELDFIRCIQNTQQEFPETIPQSAEVGQEQLGIGDDACIWSGMGPQCLSVDSVVEDVHFTADDSIEDIGHKAIATALSDLAAMGALPIGLTLAVQMRAGIAVDALAAALVKACAKYKCPLFGGDTTSAKKLSISVTVWGKPAHEQRLLKRSEAQVGDLLISTGRLGGSFQSGRHLCCEPRLEWGAWLARHEEIHAMMDCSDGLALDAQRMAEASDCGVLLYADKIPVHDDVSTEGDPIKHACCDGEDFELIFAVEAADWLRIQLAWPFEQPLHLCGMFITDEGAFIEMMGRKVIPIPWTGYEHSWD